MQFVRRSTGNEPDTGGLSLRFANTVSPATSARSGFRQAAPLVNTLVAIVSLLALAGCGAGLASVPPSSGSSSLAVSPVSVSFGNDPLNTTVSQGISLTNDGPASIVVQSTSVSGSAAFEISNWNGAVTIPAGGSHQLEVSFTPTTSSSYNATLGVATVQTGKSVLSSISLSGIGRTPGGPTVSVSISPTSAILKTGASEQFNATVTGTTNTAVSWLINGVQGGNSTVGTISSTGLYTAPKAPPSGGAVTVAARSMADASKSADATLTITPSTPITVTISPTSAVLQVGLSEQFTATVQGTTNTAVNWLVNGVQNGNSTVGTVSSSGSYTAPQAVPSGGTVTVAARSVADSTQSAAAQVTITPGSSQVIVTISPTSANVSAGGAEQFTATVTGTSNTSVNWFVAGIQGGNAGVGTISSTGLYTAPVCPTPGNQTVTATSVYDSSASANATIAISSGKSTGDYYVATNGSDSNDGSACNPWASIAHAAKAIGPGATVHVAPGAYSGPVSTSVSGSASSRIRYISDSQHRATIECTSSCDMVWTQSGNYVDVLGFELTSTNPATRIGFEWTGSNGLVQGNEVHDIQCSGCVGNGGAGINVDNGSAYTAVDANLVYNIDIAGKGNADSLYVHGIYVHTYYNVISNNLVYRCAGWGVEQGHEVSNSTVVNNTIFECGGGVMIGTGGSSGTSNNNVINNNILVYNGPGYSGHGYGIDAIQNYGPNNTITDNVFYGNQPGNVSSALNGNATVTGSITNIDPNTGTLFVDWQSDGSGDYHLASGSPAINAGTNSNAPGDDYDGGHRPGGGAWDIGAYEWNAASGKWPWD